MNKPKTTWEKIKFYLGFCHLCWGRIERFSWHRAFCKTCGESWEVTGL